MKRRLAAALAIALGLAPVALPYYHFIRYSTTTGPYVPFYSRFDNTSLPDKTVLVLVSDKDTAALTLASGDSYTAVISQVRAAAQVWNAVEASDLRVQFGGIFTPGIVTGTPDIEVIFDELPDGVVGMGGPVVKGDVINGPNGPFTPILKSQVVLPRNMTSRASWTEGFFLTAVHELGHALGLQHTYTSSVMSTEVTRGTTKAAPLGADDIAGLSILYPTKNFGLNTGSITGRVTTGGSPIALASVVALTPNGGAVSALSQPDGSYRIDGLAPGFYYVYAHPLPPANTVESRTGAAVNVELPVDPNGSVQPGPAFDLQFFPGTRTPQQTIYVGGASTVEGVSFDVSRRDRVNLYGVQTYSFYTDVAVKPGFILTSAQQGMLVMAGAGLVSNRAPAPGLALSFIGAPEAVPAGGLRAYSPAPDWYLQADVQLVPFSGEATRHLLFTTPSESYVLPAGAMLVSKQPPSFTLAENSDNTVTLTGSTLTAATRIYFDGVPVATAVTGDGQLTVTPPPGPSNHQAFVTAMNPDGQSSYFVLGTNSPKYTYAAADDPQITGVSPAALPAGVEAMVEITGTGMGFSSDALVRAGFGTSDVQVHRAWAAGPDRIVAQVLVAPTAVSSMETVTAISGLKWAVRQYGFTVNAPNPNQMYVALSQVPGLYAYPGAAVTVPVANLASTPAPSAFAVTVNNEAAAVLTSNENQLTFQIPASAVPGLGVVKIFVNGEPVLPAAIPIEGPPPAILSAVRGANSIIDVGSPARPGETIQLIVANVGNGTDTIDPALLKITGGTADHSVQFVQTNKAQAGTYLVTVKLSDAAAPSSGVLPLTLTFGGHASGTFALACTVK